MGEVTSRYVYVHVQGMYLVLMHMGCEDHGIAMLPTSKAFEYVAYK